MNAIWILGRLVKEPQPREYSGKDGVIKQALSFLIKDTDDFGHVQFVKCILFGSAERVGYFRRIMRPGLRYLFLGNIRIENYEREIQDKDGQTRMIKQQGITLLAREIRFAYRIGKCQDAEIEDMKVYHARTEDIPDLASILHMEEDESGIE